MDRYNVGSISTSNTYGGVEVDWLEDDDMHLFKFNIPGLKVEDVNVEVIGGNILQVTGARRATSDRSFGKWHVRERPLGAFFRKFQLPGPVKANEVVAFDEKGVLNVTLPKAKTSFLRNIPISMLPSTY